MNDLQKEQVDLILAQAKVDSTPGIPICCQEHKELGWVQLHFLFFDLLADERSGPILAEQTCLN